MRRIITATSLVLLLAGCQAQSLEDFEETTNETSQEEENITGALADPGLNAIISLSGEYETTIDQTVWNRADVEVYIGDVVIQESGRYTGNRDVFCLYIPEPEWLDDLPPNLQGPKEKYEHLLDTVTEFERGGLLEHDEYLPLPDPCEGFNSHWKLAAFLETCAIEDAGCYLGRQPNEYMIGVLLEAGRPFEILKQECPEEEE